jgi:N-6 DNA methylase
MSDVVNKLWGFCHTLRHDGIDVKGAAFEGLLEKAASEGKKGAGQYLTPRVLIQPIVRVMRPDPRGKSEFKICDPACGTCGFLVVAYEWLVSPKVSGGVFDREDAKRIKTKTYYGQDLVPRPRRLALTTPHRGQAGRAAGQGGRQSAAAGEDSGHPQAFPPGGAGRCLLRTTDGGLAGGTGGHPPPRPLPSREGEEKGRHSRCCRRRRCLSISLSHGGRGSG